MNEKSMKHAVVIGSSMAGLTAARMLTNHFNRVTIIDRDYLPETPEFRRGTPHARHAHTLPLRGQALLEEFFPGLMVELLDQGAVSINVGSEMAFYIAGGWHQLRRHSANLFMACSRPLLDTLIYRRVASHPAVRVVQGHDVIGLEVEKAGGQVTGVRLRGRGNPVATRLPADLVVDASGRMSRAALWLAELGYAPPAESVVDAGVGYTTRIYRKPAGFNESWKTMYIKPAPRDGSRGGMIIPIEGDRWHVAVVGVGGDYPPTDEAGFLDFARNLPTPRLYEAIRNAEPLTKPYGYRRTESRMRHYDELPRYLEGLVVTGDAVYALNPIYAQGMTAAALGSVALNESLQAARGNLVGLARTFQQALSRAVAETWDMVIGQDRRWSTTQVVS